MHNQDDRDEASTGPAGADAPSAARAAATDPRGTDPPSARLVDHDDLRRREREWYAARDETAPSPRKVPRVPTAPWQLPPRRDERDDDVEDGDDEDPKLRRSRRVAVFGGVFAVWALAMLAFDVRWWNFDDHGPWLTPFTPLLLGGAVEQALLRRWPEWGRDHDPAVVPDRRRGAEALGERARPYWAREGAGGIGGTTPASGLGAGPAGGLGVGPAGGTGAARDADAPVGDGHGPAGSPADLSARTDRSP